MQSAIDNLKAELRADPANAELRLHLIELLLDASDPEEAAFQTDCLEAIHEVAMTGHIQVRVPLDSLTMVDIAAKTLRFFDVAAMAREAQIPQPWTLTQVMQIGEWILEEESKENPGVWGMPARIDYDDLMAEHEN